MPLAPARRLSRRAYSLFLIVALAALMSAGCSSSKNKSSNSTGTQSLATTSVATTSTVSQPPTTATTTAGGATSPFQGDWTGTYQSTKFPTTTGTFQVTFTVTGSSIEGHITLTSACISSATIAGVVTNDVIQFGALKSDNDTTAVSFTGMISGTHLSGNYNSDASCGSDEGTWKADKV